VDGNDLFAVYKASRDAIDRARAGGGVTLIEAITYRLADHTTADDARRYRDEEEVASWRGKDPLIRLRKYLERKGMWDDSKQAAHEEKCKAQVAEIVKNVETIEAPTTDDIFDWTYGTELPAELQRQKATMRTTSLGQNPEQAGLGARERHEA
jgi:pyruvate dehydrogenase E1 component alpha subunit